MTDPERWLESREVPAEVARLLRAAKAPRAMTGAERARSSRRVAALAALPAGAAALFWIKGIALGAAVAGSTAVLVATKVLDRPEPVPPPATSHTALPALDAPRPPPAEPAVPLAEPPQSAMPRSDDPAPARGREAVGQDLLGLEAARLEQARHALAANDPGRAFGHLRRHAAEFPGGQLTVERELLTVEALRQLGRHAEACARARALLERSPGIMYRDRLQCPAEAAPAPAASP